MKALWRDHSKTIVGLVSGGGICFGARLAWPKGGPDFDLVTIVGAILLGFGLQGVIDARFREVASRKTSPNEPSLRLDHDPDFIARHVEIRKRCPKAIKHLLNLLGKGNTLLNDDVVAESAMTVFKNFQNMGYHLMLLSDWSRRNSIAPIDC